MTELTQEYVRWLFRFEPETGLLFWNRIPEKSNLWNGKYAERQAGSIFWSEHGKRYWRVKIDGRSYLSHRIIWLYLYGYFPNMIDHWDGNGLNNLPINLREATGSQNQANAKGPAIDVVGKKFRAKITVKYQQYYLGIFETYEEAEMVYKETSIMYFGQFSKYQREQSCPSL